MERTTKTGLKRLMRAALDVEMRRKVHRELRGSFCSGIVMGLRAALKPGDICVDLGANVGEITVPLAQTGATVHAFEPDPDTHRTLQTACASLDTAILHEAEVGTEVGHMTLYRSRLLEKDVKRARPVPRSMPPKLSPTPKTPLRSLSWMPSPSSKT